MHSTMYNGQSHNSSTASLNTKMLRVGGLSIDHGRRDFRQGLNGALVNGGFVNGGLPVRRCYTSQSLYSNGHAPDGVLPYRLIQQFNQPLLRRPRSGRTSCTTELSRSSSPASLSGTFSPPSGSSGSSRTLMSPTGMPGPRRVFPQRASQPRLVGIEGEKNPSDDKNVPSRTCLSHMKLNSCNFCYEKSVFSRLSEILYLCFPSLNRLAKNRYRRISCGFRCGTKFWYRIPAQRPIQNPRCSAGPTDSRASGAEHNFSVYLPQDRGLPTADRSCHGGVEAPREERSRWRHESHDGLVRTLARIWSWNDNTSAIFKIRFNSWNSYRLLETTVELKYTSLHKNKIAHMKGGANFNCGCTWKRCAWSPV